MHNELCWKLIERGICFVGNLTDVSRSSRNVNDNTCFNDTGLI